MAHIDSLYSPGITRRDHRIPEDYLKSVTDVFKSFEWNFSKDDIKSIVKTVSFFHASCVSLNHFYQRI